MKIPGEAYLKKLSRDYSPGTLVVLDSMKDCQAPPTGTRGIVLGIDSLGSILVQWESGSTLSLIPGEDAFHVNKDGMEEARRQILAIRDSGETNMFDIPVVHSLAQKRGYVALCALLEESPARYTRFILTGHLGE